MVSYVTAPHPGRAWQPFLSSNPWNISFFAQIHPMKEVILKSICLIMICLAAIGLQAQSEPESATLLIESQSGKSHHYIKTGDRLNYQLKDSSMMRKGRIESVQDSSVTVAGKVLAFKDLKTVVHLRGNKRPLGGGLVVGSLVAEPISLLLFVVSLLFLLDNPSQGQRVIIGFLAAFTLFIFPLVFVLGIILLALGSKRFDLGKDWRLRKG